MPAVRIFGLIAIFLISLHCFGTMMMERLHHSHNIVKILFFLIMVLIVEFGLWAAMAGPANVARRLRKKPKAVFLDIRASFLKLGLIHVLLLVFLLSIFMKRWP